MIRYYESVGLIPAVARTGGNYRVYSNADVHALAFVQRARALGFSIEQTRELLALWQDRSRASADVKALALAQIEQFEAKIEALTELRDCLQHLANNCHGDHRPECPILEVLSEGHEPPESASSARTDKHAAKGLMNASDSRIAWA